MLSKVARDLFFFEIAFMMFSCELKGFYFFPHPICSMLLKYQLSNIENAVKQKLKINSICLQNHGFEILIISM